MGPTRRDPEHSRAAEPDYRIFSVSLFRSHTEAVQRALDILRNAGYRNFSRSRLFQLLIEHVIADKSPEQLLALFEEAPLRRPLARTDTHTTSASADLPSLMPPPHLHRPTSAARRNRRRHLA